MVNRREFLRQSLTAAAALSLPRTGLSQVSVAPPAKQVLIIGAGMAGLSAAYELPQAGHDATVVEPRPRPGRRVFTTRGQAADGLYAEAGATHALVDHRWTGH